MNHNGILPVYKPKNISSKDVSRKLNRLFGKYKMGHVGTLDPIAEGVLPIVVGSYSRLQDTLLDSTKVYQCKVDLGFATDSLDISGKVIARSEVVGVTLEKLQDKARLLIGEITQIPPIFSAVKYKGTPLYKYVRQNKIDLVPLEKLKRVVKVYSLKVTEFSGKSFTFVAEVSKGTYIRLLAQELGKLVGTHATVSELFRQKSGGIVAEKSYSLDFLEKAVVQGKTISDYFVSLKDLELDNIFYKIEPQDKIRINHGQMIKKTMEEFTARSSLNMDFAKNLKVGIAIILEDADDSLLAIAVIKDVTKDSILFRMQRSLI
jgi:tRNA pseudouridine55 synthase